MKQGRMDEGDLKELRELVEFLKASGVAEFDMERPELKVRLSFASAAPATVAPSGGLDVGQLAAFMAAGNAAASSAASSQTVDTVPAPSAAAPVAAATLEAEPEAGLHLVKSPLVGTFYEAASPGAEAFVKIGDRVAAGKVLCIVEAMKIMNEIESDASGEVVEVYVKAGQPVEYGQKLFALKA